MSFHHPTTDLHRARPTLWADGLAAVADRYDSWIVDQWGVLHNGVAAYPGAADALRRLMQRGDTVVVLSNSGKRSGPNVARLASMGFDDGCYSALVTSGEVVRAALEARNDPYYATLGRRCWLVSNDGDRGVVEGLPLAQTDGPETADFVLLAGTGRAEAVNDYDAEFAIAARRGLPLICANPDFLRLTPGGLKASCGALAARYRDRFGGAVHWVGKPHAEVYAACRGLLAARGCRSTAVIGDSLEHDIAGGQGAGFGTVFLTDGIHRQEFAQAAHRDLLLRQLAERAGLAALPDVSLHQLAW